MNLHGHCHPHIAQKVSEQVAHLDHVIFAENTHRPAIDLATKLVGIAPANLSRVFYSDNGSTAVEVALKMALQYWYNKGQKRKRMLAFKNGYHGDTFGAMSVGQPCPLNGPFQDKLFPVDFIEPPLRGKENIGLDELKNLLAQKKDYACFIYEPLVQGAGGLLMQDPQGLDEILALLKSEGILCIADEVMTGFGRTGNIFSSESMKQQPDLMCLAKGITGGVLPLSATLCSEQVYEAFLSDDKTKAFFHGHSYTANPLGCAAGLASYDLLVKNECFQQRQMIQSCHHEFMDEVKSSPYMKFVEDVRVQGTILALDLKTNESSGYFNLIAEKIKKFVHTTDVLIRPFGNMLHVLPPYCSTKEDLRNSYNCMIDCIRYLYL